MRNNNVSTNIAAGIVAEHEQLMRIEPVQRKSLDFDGALDIVTIERHPLYYEISADLANMVKQCQHCSAGNLSLHGRYVVRLADLPYVDEHKRVLPVQYAVSSQRYQCGSCKRGTVEPLPDLLRPVISNARITKRLSEWLLHEVQTDTSYDTLARMTGYSKVWVRKWFDSVRQVTNLQRKPSRPGPKKTAAE